MGGDMIAGWEVPLTQHFVNPGDTLGYEYDFGDGWYHSVDLVSVVVREPKQKYPRCVDGARACPPEDCGGVPGYYMLLDALADPADEQHDDMIDWLQNHAKNYYPYDPDAFAPESVRFANPKTRFKRVFGAA